MSLPLCFVVCTSFPIYCLCVLCLALCLSSVCVCVSVCVICGLFYVVVSAVVLCVLFVILYAHGLSPVSYFCILYVL